MDFNNNMLGFNGREARLAGRVREMEEQNQLLRRQLTVSQNQLVAAVKTNQSVKPQTPTPLCQNQEVTIIIIISCRFLNKFVNEERSLLQPLVSFFLECFGWSLKLIRPKLK